MSEVRSDLYNERLARARSGKKMQVNVVEQSPPEPVKESETKIDIPEPPKAEPEFRNGKWYDYLGQEVHVKKVIKLSWKW